MKKTKEAYYNVPLTKRYSWRPRTIGQVALGYTLGIVGFGLIMTALARLFAWIWMA